MYLYIRGKMVYKNLTTFNTSSLRILTATQDSIMTGLDKLETLQYLIVL
jgi:hypothetical protein